VFVNVLLHCLTKLLLEWVVPQLPVVFWWRREITSMVLRDRGVEGRLLGLWDTVLMEVEEPFFLPAFELLNDRWLDVRWVW